MKILLADSGSTKTQWALMLDGVKVAEVVGPGINPVVMKETVIRDILSSVVTDNPQLQDADAIEFYGSGCTPAAIPLMEQMLKDEMRCKYVTVMSDIVGAAKAVCGKEKGIACILGTGANSCLWDGEKIVRQTPALGYILGDEGGGAVLGKKFINGIYKGVLSKDIRDEFEAEYDIDMAGVIEKVYRQEGGNRWLASTSVFINKHLDVKEIRKMVKENFDAFVERNLLPYNCPELEVSFVGSIAFYYEEILRESLAEHGLKVGRVVKNIL